MAKIIHSVTSLYDKDMAFAVLGYPGSSWEKGGYITRGFQDLKWLPAPSKEASPPPWFGWRARTCWTGPLPCKSWSPSTPGPKAKWA